VTLHNHGTADLAPIRTTFPRTLAVCWGVIAVSVIFSVSMYFILINIPTENRPIQFEEFTVGLAYWAVYAQFLLLPAHVVVLILFTIRWFSEYRRLISFSLFFVWVYTISEVLVVGFATLGLVFFASPG